MNQTPLVSIVIPAFNPRFFSAALQSALDQTWGCLEIIVSDDSPCDEIKNIVEALLVPASVTLRYWKNPVRLGFVQNVLYGVAEARGEFIKVLCDDDRLIRECVCLQAQVLVANHDVSLVINQRFMSDEDDYVLPTRLINCQLSAVDTLYNGGDVLALLHRSVVNFLGNFSSALVRAHDLKALLPVLTQDGGGFSALLDFALFICLLRRGHMVMLRAVLSVERLHPARLSKQPEMLQVAEVERDWLKTMLAGRGSEEAPAAGWVRTVELDQRVPGAPYDWQEMALQRLLGNTHNSLQARVGSRSESYAEFYADWLQARRFSDNERRLMASRIAAWPARPRIGVVICDPRADVAGLQVTLLSLETQMYAPQAVAVFSACKPKSDVAQCFPWREDWSGQLDEVLQVLPQVDWVYLLQSGDQLFESTLLVLAERIANKPDVACIYSDESRLVDGVFSESVFKPDFNVDLMRSYPYVGRALAFSIELAAKAGGFFSPHRELAPHDLLWRLVEGYGPQAIEHIPEMQLASSFSFAEWLSLPEMVEANRRLLKAHLERLGVEYSIRAGDLPLINRVDYLLASEPLVSIIISSGRRLADLQQCIETLIEKTVGVRYEILIVVQPGLAPEMLSWLQAMAQLDSKLLRVLDSEHGLTGVASLNNHAAGHARGDYLLFLSPHALFVSAQWLAELLNHAHRPEVGVVGGRLLSSYNTIYNVGLIMGLNGVASSPFIGEAASARGYMQRLWVNQNWSAVSGECLMIRKEVFESVNGFDADPFKYSLYDVDLCLRIGRQGYLVVGTPYASVVLTSPLDQERTAEMLARLGEEREFFYSRWIDTIAWDRSYNPNLSLGVSSFSLNAGLITGWNPFCARSLPAVLVLPVNNTAVGHYRVIQPLRELEGAGRVLGWCVFDSPSVVNVRRMAPDVIVLQCRYASNSPAYIESLKKYSSALRVFELDDYVIKAPKKNTHARNKAADIAETLAQSIGLCDRVVVTTQALKEAISNMHDDIRVVPNMLPVHPWSTLKSRRRSSSRPRVGWGGGTSHTGDLEVIADVVRELATEVEWVFFGMCPDELRPYIHEFHPVIDLKVYPAKLASLNLDLALAPLEFHIFNDCKSNLRLLEYGACGYPVVCTDTEAYRGFLPCTRVKSNSTEEWLEAIRMHLADPEASYRMGDLLREAVLENFMLTGKNLKHWEWGWLPD